MSVAHPSTCKSALPASSPLCFSRGKGGWKRIRRWERVGGRRKEGDPPKTSTSPSPNSQSPQLYTYQKQIFNQVNKTILNTLLLVYKYGFIIILNIFLIFKKKSSKNFK